MSYEVLHQLCQIAKVHHEVLKSMLNELEVPPRPPYDDNSIVQLADWIPESLDKLKSVDYLLEIPEKGKE